MNKKRSGFLWETAASGVPAYLSGSKYIVKFNFKIMKNLLKKLPVLAFILSIGTAFAFTSSNEVNQVFYRDANGIFLEKISAGECLPGSWNCEYIYVGTGTPGMDQHPDSYQATGLEDRIFVPE